MTPGKPPLGASAASADDGEDGVFLAAVQRALLPAGLPVLPRAQIGACYLTAARDNIAGGDWFDAVPFGDRAVALVAGDIAGCGVAASAAMGQLRAVLGELLAASTDLDEVLARADAFAARVPALRAASLGVAVLDPDTGMLRYATCGSPPPLIAAADGAARFLPCTGAGPLGVGLPLTLAGGLLRPGEALLLYTNGIICRPGRTVSEGMAELAAAAALAAIAPPGPAGRPPAGQRGTGSPPHDHAEARADRICRQTVQELTATDYDDDIAVVAACRLADAVQPLQLALPARLGSVKIIRRAFAEWLDQLKPATRERTDLELAIAETVTNAVEHAYRATEPGHVELAAMLTADGRIDCSITDYGTWRPPDPAATHRGYGLMVASQVVDQIEVRHPRRAAGGAPEAPETIVRLRHRLRRTPILGIRARQAPAVPTGLAGQFAVQTTLQESASRVSVSGPVDVATAPRLGRQLLTAGRGGTVSLTVDVTGVSQLTSAGIRVLYEVRDKAAAQGQELTLVAAPGTSVALILEFAQLISPVPADVSGSG